MPFARDVRSMPYIEVSLPTFLMHTPPVLSRRVIASRAWYKNATATGRKLKERRRPK